MRKLPGVFLAIVLLLGLATTPASAQGDSWKNKWYWGAQSGAFIYSTPTQSHEAAFDIGGHWLITRDRVALDVAIDQLFFQDNTTSTVPDASSTNGTRTVSFSNGRRVQLELYAMPMDGPIQVFLGGGFAIHQITDAKAQGTFASQAQQTAVARIVDDQDTKAFAVLGGGVQYLIGRWAVFGRYQYIPQAEDFLLTSEQHAITGGIRFALTRSSEDISTKR
ncbi:MAG: hypothetical protein ACE5HT_12455 [Gemmatimonadales bacterium]